MFSYIDEYKELKQVIKENPELPLVFMASEDCGNPDYGWSLATAKAEKGILLDCKTYEANDEKLYTDEDDFREDIEGYVYDNYDISERESEEKINEIIKKYENKWKEVIFVYVDAY